MIKKILKIIFPVSLTLIIFLLFFIFNPLWQANSEEIVVKVEEGDGLMQTVSKIKDEGVIKFSFPFLSYVMITGNSDNLKAGKYRFSKNMNIIDITNKITSGEIIEKKITIIEGWSLIDIAEHLEEVGFCTKEELFLITGLSKPQARILDFEKMPHELNGYEILQNLPKDASLEGYLFPDTYKVKNGDPKVLLNQMVSNLETKIKPYLPQIKESGKTPHEIITMASLIEKEVISKKDKRMVSDILWRRIRAGIPLQIDATVNYVTGHNNTNVLISETEIDSSYNTYKYLGLPEGPISNPGLESIKAAINPKSNDYWYYLSNPETDETIFSRTHREHIQAKNKYLK